ncbi:arginine/serine-rich protein PNISR-like isoform X2 [Rhopilema esculentum]
MWAQQRQLHSQMQQNHPPDTGQTHPPPPEVTSHPPLPSENAPTQPPPPDAINNASAFVHKERLDLLEGGNQGNDPSRPWNNQHNDQHQSGLIQPQTGQGYRKGHWKPIGGSAFDDSDRPFDNNYEQENHIPDERKVPEGDNGRFSGQDLERDSHFSDQYGSDPSQYRQEVNSWVQNQQWDNRNWPPFPPQPEMHFPHPPMPFMPVQQPIPGLVMPNFFQPPVVSQMQPKPRPDLSIPDQVIASQVPEINVQEMNKKKGLPQWLRDALNKKEKEKQKKLEKEKASTKDDEDSEDEIKTLPEEKVETTKGAVKKNSPVHDGYSSDDEKENVKSDEDENQNEAISNEEKAYEQMQKIKYWMMETLVTVTNEEIVSVVNEVYSRARRKARVSGELLRNSGGLAALRTGLALEYDSSSGNESDDESDEDDKPSRWLEHEKRERQKQTHTSISQTRDDKLERHLSREGSVEDERRSNRTTERREASKHSDEKKRRKRTRSESSESEPDKEKKVVKDRKVAKKEYEREHYYDTSKSKKRNKSKETDSSSTSGSSDSSDDREAKKRRTKVKKDSDSDDRERRQVKKKKKKHSRSQDKRSRETGHDSEGSDKGSSEKKSKRSKKREHRTKSRSSSNDSSHDKKETKRRDSIYEKRREGDRRERSRKDVSVEREEREERKDGKARDKKTVEDRSTDRHKGERKSKKKSRKNRGES